MAAEQRHGRYGAGWVAGAARSTDADEARAPEDDQYDDDLSDGELRDAA